MLDISVANGWGAVIEDFSASAEGSSLEGYLEAEKKRDEPIYPPNPFRALQLVPPENVRVVIIGQDPYHGPGQANGLAFSVNPGVRIPPSLRNIYKEITREYGCTNFKNGDLTGWAQQGVLLLNAVLTVLEGKPASHAKKGWEKLTDEIIATTAKSDRPVVYMLWGNYAKQKRALIEKYAKSALILESNHPSPLSATRAPEPFIGNNHFKQANDWLIRHKCSPIDWCQTASERALGL